MGAFSETIVKTGDLDIEDMITDVTIGDDSYEVIDFLFVGISRDGGIHIETNATCKNKYMHVVRQAVEATNHMLETIRSKEGK